MDNSFIEAAALVCDYCKKTENYWLSSCSDANDGMYTCPVAQMLQELEEEDA